MTQKEKEILNYLTILAERSLRYLWVITGGVVTVLIYCIVAHS